MHTSRRLFLGDEWAGQLPGVGLGLEVSSLVPPPVFYFCHVGATHTSLIFSSALRRQGGEYTPKSNACSHHSFAAAAPSAAAAAAVAAIAAVAAAAAELEGRAANRQQETKSAAEVQQQRSSS